MHELKTSRSNSFGVVEIWKSSRGLNRLLLHTGLLAWCLQDLASWPHMKEVKKLYLIVMERRENPQAEVASNSEPAESALALGAGIPSETSCAGDQAVDSELTPTEAQQEASATSSLDAEAFFDAEDQKMDGSGDSEDGKKKKRKNR